MGDGKERAQYAQVGDLLLETWIIDDRYFWSAKDIVKRVDIDSGEANSRWGQGRCEEDSLQEACSQKGREVSSFL